MSLSKDMLKSSHPVLMNVTLSGNRVFAHDYVEVIKVGPSPMRCVLIKRGKFGYRTECTEGRQCERQGEGHVKIGELLPMPRKSWDHRSQKSKEGSFPYSFQREWGPAETLILTWRLQYCEAIDFEVTQVAVLFIAGLGIEHSI